MFTKNRLIILFTLLYLFIEIGFRALVNEHLRAPGVAKDVTDMFVVLGRLISAIGFTVILFNLLKNNETVSEHPKKCIAGLYLSSFIVISVITSLALTWLPIETQMRAFYAHYYKTAAYYSSVENSKTPVNISEARLTTLPLLMITETPFSDVQDYAEPLIPKTIDNLVYGNQRFYLKSLGKIENQYSGFWVQYQKAYSLQEYKTSGKQLEEGAMWIKALYRKYAREAFLDYRADVLESFDLKAIRFIKSSVEDSREFHHDENWQTETYAQSGKVLWSPNVNKSLLSGKHRRDEVINLHTLENGFKKERHGFNSIESSAEFYELLRRHENYFKSRLSFSGNPTTVNAEHASQLLDYASSLCQEYKRDSIPSEKKRLINGRTNAAVYTVTSTDDKNEFSFIPVDYPGFKNNLTICDYRNIDTRIRKLLVDKANSENITRGFKRDINSLSEFKKTAYAKQKITERLEQRLGIKLDTITTANTAYFGRAYKAVVAKEIKKEISEKAASAKLSCHKKCGEIIPLGLDRVSLLSLPVFREKLQPEFPDMFDSNDRFISATESKESQHRTLQRISEKQKKESQRILALIHNGQVKKADLAPYTRATLGPILLMIFANAAILLNFASLLLTIFKVKRKDVAVLISLLMLSLPLIAEKYGTNSRFALTTTHDKTLTWLLGTNRVISTIPVVERAAKRTTMHLLHWHLEFFRDNVGKDQLRGELYQRLK